MATKASKRPAKPRTVQTVWNETVPAAEVAHIAPALQRFAVRIDSLKLDPENARSHGTEDQATTRNSLKEFGQQHLIHFDEQSRVVKIGNGRLMGARELKWAYVAAIPSNLPPERLKAFAIVDNRSGELAGWIKQQLEQQVPELQNLGIDMEQFALGADDLQRMLGEAEATVRDNLKQEPRQHEPVAPDTQPRLDQRATPPVRTVRCPECGHAFTPQRAPGVLQP